MSAKKEDQAVATQGEAQFPILGDKAKMDDFLEVIQENLDGMSLGPFNLDRVKIPTGGNTFWTVTTLEGEDAVKEILGIMIEKIYARDFWKTPYGSGDGNGPPDCSGRQDGIGIGDPGPRGVPQVGKDGQPVAGHWLCSACPNNAWGSGAKPGTKSKSKACGENLRTFMLRPGETLPTMIIIKSGSYQEAMSYLRRLTQMNLRHWGVITSLTLEKATNADNIDYCKVKFACKGELSPEQRGMIKQYALAIRPSLQSVQVTQEDFAPAGDEKIAF